MGVQHLLARREGGVVGYAELEATGTGDAAEFAAELIVGPHHRRQGIGRELAEAAITLAGAAQLRVWAHGDGAGAVALAERMGFVRSRVLLQMRRDLAGELPEAQWPPGTVVRTFMPGADEAAWLAVNAAAFATHPEQGRWRMADLQQRESQDWFDPHGFFLAERDGTLVGFHWTKVHRGERPPIGEVYVVGVLPRSGRSGARARADTGRFASPCGAGARERPAVRRRVERGGAQDVRAARLLPMGDRRDVQPSRLSKCGRRFVCL